MHLLHSKGLLTVLLISISEGVSVAKAVTFQNTYNTYTADHKQHHQSKHPTNEESVCVAGETCPSSVPRFNNNRKAKPNDVIDCLSDCCSRTPTDVQEPSSSLSLCESLRGGHIDHEHVSAAAASAVATTPYNIPLYLWKIIFQFFLTSINVFCWLVPLKSKKISENKLALGLANAFSGGVFLTLAFGHLLPECVHGFEGYNEALPYMIVLGGYLLIFFVEKVAFDTHSFLDHGHNHDHGHTAVENKKTSNGDTKEPTEFIGGRSAIILLGALAVHSVLEMTALGLANTFGDSALLSLSIALHQPAESIALLVAFLKSGMPHPQIITYLSIFSTMGPIGVALGMVVKNFAAPIVDSIMLAVVAGTFIYVGATEVIPEEWEESEHKWKKFFALLSGIVSIFAITQYTTGLEAHSH